MRPVEIIPSIGKPYLLHCMSYSGIFFREINHWLVINIKGNDISTGETITSYRGSGPPKGSGLHRYIFIVFEQSDKISVSEENLESERRNFSIRRFAEKYGLGKAYAGNFYKAQWDSSVPERRA